MTTIQTETKTCPDWCTEHMHEIDGSVFGHSCQVAHNTGARRLNIAVRLLDGRGSFVDLTATDADLSPMEARRVATALIEAAKLAEGHLVDPDAEDLTAVIRSQMKAAKLSQRALSEVTGIPLPTLSRRLTSHAGGWTVPELAAVSESIGLSVSELFRAAAKYTMRRLNND